MADKLKKIIVEMPNKSYEFYGSTGPGSVGHEELKDDSVGTNNIVNGGVMMEDLNDDVMEKIHKTYDEDDEALHMYFEEDDVNNSNHDY